MIQRFKKCWDNFIEQYRSNSHLHILNNNWLKGKPSIWYWGEDDIKMHLSVKCLCEFGNQMVHPEVNFNDPKARIDLAILENDPRYYINVEQFIQQQHGQFYQILNTIDLGVEIALIVNNGFNEKTYNTGKILKNIKTLCNLKDTQKITKGVVCFIDNIHENIYNGDDYNNLFNECQGFNFTIDDLQFQNNCLQWCNEDQSLAIFGFLDKHLQPHRNNIENFLNPNN